MVKSAAPPPLPGCTAHRAPAPRHWRRHLRAWWIPALALLLPWLGGCRFSAVDGEGKLGCATDDDCLVGYRCVAARCCRVAECPDEPAPCTPGASRVCACPQGGTGSERCDPLSRRWSDCSCPEIAREVEGEGHEVEGEGHEVEGEGHEGEGEGGTLPECQPGEPSVCVCQGGVGLRRCDPTGRWGPCGCSEEGEGEEGEGEEGEGEEGEGEEVAGEEGEGEEGEGEEGEGEEGEGEEGEGVEGVG
ncbi:MAG: hypothetical protein RBU45_17060, partial [Myxococcota bacterium]|nr:hypothetical protein [Myxococcota bacterium]